MILFSSIVNAETKRKRARESRWASSNLSLFAKTTIDGSEGGREKLSYIFIKKYALLYLIKGIVTNSYCMKGLKPWLFSIVFGQLDVECVRNRCQSSVHSQASLTTCSGGEENFANVLAHCFPALIVSRPGFGCVLFRSVTSDVRFGGKTTICS